MAGGRGADIALTRSLVNGEVIGGAEHQHYRQCHRALSVVFPAPAESDSVLRSGGRRERVPSPDARGMPTEQRHQHRRRDLRSRSLPATTQDALLYPQRGRRREGERHRLQATHPGGVRQEGRRQRRAGVVQAQSVCGGSRISVVKCDGSFSTVLVSALTESRRLPASASNRNHPILTILTEVSPASDLRILLPPFAEGILVNPGREDSPARSSRSPTRMPAVRVQGMQEPCGKDG